MRHLAIAIAVLLAGPVMAEVGPKIHKLCLEAKDYKGCIEQHSQNDNKQVMTPIEKYKLVKVYAMLLCEDGSSFGEWTQEKRSSVAALHTGLQYDQVFLESYFSRLQNETRDEMQKITSAKCPQQQDAYARKVAEKGNREWATIKPLQPSDFTSTERPAEAASVATWQDYCNSQGKTYYERTSGLSWFGITLSNKKEWQGCLTDAEAVQAGAGTTTYKPVNPRSPVNCYGSGYATGGNSYNTKTTCY